MFCQYIDFHANILHFFFSHVLNVPYVDFMEILSVNIILFPNDQYSSSSFYTSAFVDGQPQSMNSANVLRC